MIIVDYVLLFMMDDWCWTVQFMYVDKWSNGDVCGLDYTGYSFIVVCNIWNMIDMTRDRWKFEENVF